MLPCRSAFQACEITRLARTVPIYTFKGVLLGARLFVLARARAAAHVSAVGASSWGMPLAKARSEVLG